VPEAARGERSEPGLTINEIGSLASLVADIAAGGKARIAAKTRGQYG
jgi:hypothetical protein